jgi:hypothetical protein
MPVDWVLERPDRVGAMPTQILGRPQGGSGLWGSSLEFDGIGDGIILPQLPIAGWPQFSAEVVFRPDADGLAEQRFVHLQAEDGQHRMLFETRLDGDGRWFLDTYLCSERTDCTLFAQEYKHEVGRWYHAALVCDGRRMCHYVDGQLELESVVDYTPMGTGKTSVGVRQNQVCWFKGAVARLRFSPQALSPDEFMSL